MMGFNSMVSFATMAALTLNATALNVDKDEHRKF